MKGLDYWAMLFVASVRNIFTHKVKSMVVGLLMLFGTFLVITGTALLDSIEDSMSKSITSSLAGHLQIYSSEGQDDLAIFGGMMMGREEIGRIANFDELQKVVEPVANVKAVVPMGIDIATVTGGNEIDRVADALRAALAKKDLAEVSALREQLIQIAEILRTELDAKLAITAAPETVKADLASIDRLRSNAFWEEIRGGSELALQFIETKIAPMSRDGLLVYLRYVGTDLEKFKRNFERFEIVKGQMVPANQRGFLFADKFYENQIKHKVARDLDKIHREVTENGKRISEDELLRSLIKQNAQQYRRITFQLRPEDARKLSLELAQTLGAANTATTTPTLSSMLQSFLLVDDENLESRYEFFYRVIAPMIELYKVGIGDVMTVRAYTRSGYLKAANVKVYGTFNFRGLEKSDLAAAANLIDIVTFRDLYGLMSERRKAELEQIKASAGVEEVQANEAEDTLFGSGTAAATEVADDGDGFDEFANVDLSSNDDWVTKLISQKYDQATIDRGVALNAAVILDDIEGLDETKLAIEEALTAAGLKMKIVKWQAASGIVGQFITVIRLVLYIAITIIFLVALVIINNTMVMATMERTTEIGTLRAMGAQRSTVMTMFLFETVVLGVIAGILGAAVASGLIVWLHAVGIPAGSQDVLIFLFGGPRLHPGIGLDNILIGLISIFVVSLISTLYPARLATHIQPVVAMQGKD